MTAPPRDRARRLRDTRHRLEHDVDAWVATASSDGAAHLVPLSFLWDGAAFLIATPDSSVTARNLRDGRRVRLGLGPTRDVVLVEGVAEPLPDAGPSAAVGDAFAARTGFDPRELEGYRFFRIRPSRVQAWREANELAGRELMVDGRWLDAPDNAPSADTLGDGA